MQSITTQLDSKPDRLYQSGDLTIGQMRATSPCSLKPFHAHEEYTFEFTDRGAMWLLEPGTRHRQVGPGEYYLLRPDQEHSQRVESEVRTLFISLSRQRVEEVGRAFTSSTKPPQFEPVVEGAQPEMWQTLAAIAREVAQVESPRDGGWGCSTANGTQLMLQSLSLQLIVQLLRCQSGIGDEKETSHERGAFSPEIRRSLEFIHAYYTEDLSLEQIAGSVALSQYYFLRLFKRQTGFTPYEYVRRLRLSEAAGRLKGTNTSITEIALQLGFASASHLSEAFRRQYGCTPSEHRAQRAII